jgi:LysR family glycine cleavage system transcriptional activator
MTVAAAVHGMGLALVPRLLIDSELARGELVVACERPLANHRAYYLVRPDGRDNPPAPQIFLDWLVQSVQNAPRVTRIPVG